MLLVEEIQTPTCYRHADRISGLSCSRCGRVICGDCSTPASVGQRCPECLQEQGRQTVIHGRHLRRQAFFGAPVTTAIIAAAATIQLMSWVQPGLWVSLFERMAMANFLIAQGEWWRMFTVVLLHAGLIHVGFNSLLLYQLGVALERQIGSVRFALAFLSTAATGSAFAFLLGDPDDVGVGMSGAVFGIVGVWLASGYRHRNTVQGRYVLDQMKGLVVLNAIVPFIIPQVSWQAHLGGLVGGFVIGQVWSVIGRRVDEGRTLQVLAALALTVTAVLVTRL